MKANKTDKAATNAVAMFPGLGGFRQNKFVWVSEFDQLAVVQFYDTFLELEASEDLNIIPVFINSYGGEMFGLTAMRDLIKSSRKPVATIGVGMAMSCGASLLAAGTKGYRFASEDCQILIHQVSSMAAGKTADIEEAARQVKALNDKILDNLSKDTRRAKNSFERQIQSKHNADWTMNAQTAKNWGLIDHVGIPRLVNNHHPLVLTDLVSYDRLSEMQQAQRQKPKSTKKQRNGQK
jgi:ATP-dependent Clp protease protease subunit